MPPRFDPPPPGGMTENKGNVSTLGARVLRDSSPGTAEARREPSAVRPGLYVLRALVPQVKTLGYYRMPLRDNVVHGITITACAGTPWPRSTACLAADNSFATSLIAALLLPPTRSQTPVPGAAWHP
jgi:hypothetical protein